MSKVWLIMHYTLVKMFRKTSPYWDIASPEKCRQQNSAK